MSIVSLLLLSVVSMSILLAVIAVHEYGHFWCMRRNGIRIEEFSIGMGKPLVQWKIKDPHEPAGSEQGGTTISLRMLPIGGFAKPYQKTPPKPEEQLNLAEWEQATSRWTRFKVYMAGILVNNIVAFVIMTALFYVSGKVPIVFLEWCQWAPPALQPLVCAFLGSFGMPAIMVIMAARLGSAFFSRSSGPLGIVLMGNQMIGGSVTAADAVFYVFFFFAMLNGAVASFNVFPLFPLDGGRVAAMGIEMIAGRPNTTAERRFKLWTYWLILAFALFVIGNDFFKALFRPP